MVGLCETGGGHGAIEATVVLSNTAKSKETHVYCTQRVPVSLKDEGLKLEAEKKNL